MKIKNYQYKVYIRNKKEPILLDRIEAEALMLALTESSNMRFINVPVQFRDEVVRYFMNVADIVLIEPDDKWILSSQDDEIKLSPRERKIHELYIEKVETIQDSRFLSLKQG